MEALLALHLRLHSPPDMLEGSSSRSGSAKTSAEAADFLRLPSMAGIMKDLICRTLTHRL